MSKVKYIHCESCNCKSKIKTIDNPEDGCPYCGATDKVVELQVKKNEGGDEYKFLRCNHCDKTLIETDIILAGSIQCCPLCGRDGGLVDSPVLLVTDGDKRRYMTPAQLKKHRADYKRRGANLYNRLEIYMLHQDERGDLLKILYELEIKTDYKNDNVSALVDAVQSNLDSDGYIYIPKSKREDK